MEASLAASGSEGEEALLGIVEERLQETLRLIASGLAADEEAQPSAASAPLEALTGLLVELEERIDNYDASAGELAERLVAGLQGWPLRQQAMELGQLLESYRFDEAKELLAKLRAEFEGPTMSKE